ncbi:MAG: transcriptional regulator NrdR [Candidatus Marsarchaeota archaeon]|jgi:transcriptional repressor NrdR|nr:transcriptional regulator NrdR [Candidatus Marsarchaeota archaeon]
MRCPYCSSKNTEVIDSRESPDGKSIRRRRECCSCKKRFTTYERADFENVTVIKRDNTRESFDRNKVLAGVMKACEKRKVSRAEMELLVEKIEMKLRTKGIKEIRSSAIGDMVVKELFRLDPVAYIRFASVYENFDTPEEFREAILLFRPRQKKGRKR